MKKCDGCGKQRTRKDMMWCQCCDGLYCIVDNLKGGFDSCVDRHAAE